MQIALRTPAAASRSPALAPRLRLGLPDVGEDPEAGATGRPEFIDTTGMPARTARRIAGPMAGSGIETTRPSGLLSTASSISSRMRVTENASGAL